jgi:hypothetical protein
MMIGVRILAAKSQRPSISRQGPRQFTRKTLPSNDMPQDDECIYTDQEASGRDQYYCQYFGHLQFSEIAWSINAGTNRLVQLRMSEASRLVSTRLLRMENL